MLWGDYTKVSTEDPEHPDRKAWQRTQRRHTVDVSLPPKGLGRTELPCEKIGLAADVGRDAPGRFVRHAKLEIALAQAVADQVAQALESARLFEQTQAWAQREQLASRITSRMRAAPNVQDILRIGAEELGKALGVTRSVVRLNPQSVAPEPSE